MKDLIVTSCLIVNSHQLHSQSFIYHLCINFHEIITFVNMALSLPPSATPIVSSADCIECKRIRREMLKKWQVCMLFLLWKFICLNSILNEVYDVYFIIRVGLTKTCNMYQRINNNYLCGLGEICQVFNIFSLGSYLLSNVRIQDKKLCNRTKFYLKFYRSESLAIIKFLFIFKCGSTIYI